MSRAHPLITTNRSPIPVEVVRQMAGVMPFRRAVGGYVVTSGRFTRPAEQFARVTDIKLINCKRLKSMLMEAMASVEAEPQGHTPAVQVHQSPSPSRRRAPLARVP